jgi:hypothetical protein
MSKTVATLENWGGHTSGGGGGGGCCSKSTHLPVSILNLNSHENTHGCLGKYSYL